MSEAKIVVQDPRGELAEGTVVEGEAKCRLLEVRGVISLPVSVDRLRHPGAVGACGAYVRRSYGRPGVSCPSDRPGAFCPTVVYLTRGAHRVSSQLGLDASPDHLFRATWQVHEGDASVLRGSHTADTVVRADNDGFVVLTLYGMERASVLWLALTLTPA